MATASPAILSKKKETANTGWATGFLNKPKPKKRTNKEQQVKLDPQLPVAEAMPEKESQQKSKLDNERTEHDAIALDPDTKEANALPVHQEKDMMHSNSESVLDSKEQNETKSKVKDSAKAKVGINNRKMVSKTTNSNSNSNGWAKGFLNNTTKSEKNKHSKKAKGKVPVECIAATLKRQNSEIGEVKNGDTKPHRLSPVPQPKKKTQNFSNIAISKNICNNLGENKALSSLIKTPRDPNQELWSLLKTVQGNLDLPVTLLGAADGDKAVHNKKDKNNDEDSDKDNGLSFTHPPPKPTIKNNVNQNITNHECIYKLTSESPVQQQSYDGSDSASKKKKKRKKKKNKCNKTQAAAITNPKKKSVSFGSVSVREYARCLGLDGVPADGGWPLGLSNTIVNDFPNVALVQDFEEQRQVELWQRWSKLSSPVPITPVEQEIKGTEEERRNSSSNSNDGVKGISEYDNAEQPRFPNAGLETRQYDYKKRDKDDPSSGRNPLFGTMGEEARMILLLTSSGSSIKDIPFILTPQSSSSTNNQQNNHQNNHHNTRSRSRSLSNGDQHHQVAYNDMYVSSDVKHVKQELEQLRNHRSNYMELGCSCRKVKHKKNKGNRHFSNHKVKDELRKRGALPKNHNSAKKGELEQLFLKIAEEEKCCSTQDCPCVRSGINCQADVCSCWYESHQSHSNHNHHSTLHNNSMTSIEDIEERCGNPSAIYVVNAAKINAARQQYYSYCHPVGIGNGA